MLRGRGGVNSEGRPRRTFDGKLGRDVRPHAYQAHLVRVRGGLRLRDVVWVKFALTLVSQTPPGPHVLKCSTTYYHYARAPKVQYHLQEWKHLYLYIHTFPARLLMFMMTPRPCRTIVWRITEDETTRTWLGVGVGIGGGARAKGRAWCRARARTIGRARNGNRRAVRGRGLTLTGLGSG